MPIDVALLWELQKKTSEARVIEEDLTRMPERLAQARGDLAIREQEQKGSEADKQAQVLKRRGIEKEIEALEQKVRENLGSQGKAKTNAELDAFKREGAFIREQKSNLETKVIEMFDLEEALDTKIAAAKERVSQAKRVAEERAKEIQEREAGLKSQLDTLRAAAAEVGGKLRPDVKSKFDQLARAKAGVAVVTVQRNACGGCFNALPPQFVNEIRKCERLMVCESCGRIIVSLEPPTGGDDLG